jgi:ABC-type dipeptide/oligopeptide/nickel transport system ATPase component
VSATVLSVRELSVFLHDGRAERAVVDGVTFELVAGEVLALVGESGCGKSKTAEAIMGLLPAGQARLEAGEIRLGEVDLGRLGAEAMRRVRGRDLSMVFQEPMTALDPVFRIGNQLTTPFRRHRGQSRREASSSAEALLRRLGMPDPGRVMRRYPHELSGGMRQRVLLAMAMACRPRVLIADEPTTALDVTTQAQVLEDLVRLGEEAGTAVLLITHDLGVVAHYADRALVMQRGRIVEEAGVGELFRAPAHDYTRTLIAAARGLSE